MIYLNHSKLALKKMSKPVLVRIGHGILKRLPKTTLVNTVYKLEQLAKSKGIKSIGEIAKRVKRKARSGARKIKSRVRRRSGKRFKTAITKRTRRKNYVKPNGRTIQRYRKSKSKRKFSRKQLQAQALFARRSRAGTLRR